MPSSNKYLRIFQGGDSFLGDSCKYARNNSTTKANLNGQHDVWCRHLAYLWIELANQKDRYQRLAHIEQFKSRAQQLDRTGEISSNEHSLTIDYHLLGDLLTKTANNMLVQGVNQCHFLLGTENHALAILLKRKTDEEGNEYWVLNYYDPNQTLSHYRFVCASSEKLAAVAEKLIHHWDSKNQAYFPTAPAITMAQEESVTPRILPQLEELPERELSQKMLQGLLYLSLKYGNAENTSYYLNKILALSLPSVEKFKLLQARSELNLSGLYEALKNGHIKATQIYLNTILTATVLSEEEKYKLLVTTHSVAGNAHIWAKNSENLLSKCSCITHTLRFLKNIFAIFIAKSERSGKYKAKGGEQIQLLLTKWIFSGLVRALQNDQAAVITAYVATVLATGNLSFEHKMDLLTVRNWLHYPKTKFFHCGDSIDVTPHSEAIQAYADALVSSQKLPDRDIKTLMKKLAPKNYNDFIKQAKKAFERNHIKTNHDHVTYYGAVAP